MSPETGEFIDFMLEHELMDLDNKPNKASTGYMTSLAEYKAPFVFSCFNGTTGDVDVLTHEMGHAFAGYMAMRTQPLMEQWGESTDIAEIHSMSMEQFASLTFSDSEYSLYSRAAAACLDKGPRRRSASSMRWR